MKTMSERFRDELKAIKIKIAALEQKPPLSDKAILKLEKLKDREEELHEELGDFEMVHCQCEDCGKNFIKGDEGDNERFCLRCERQSLTRNMDEIDYEDFDRLETERE